LHNYVTLEGGSHENVTKCDEGGSNSLPPVIRFADSVDSFKAQRKTRLFAKAYPM